ncbi:MAG TPA: hypothetical protein VIX12_03380 [Candidatus Binataceae bacterium]
MVKVEPTRIPGRWREGYALGLHTVSSTYIGDNEYGHPQFDTTYSEIGELLYRLKSQADKAVISEIVAALRLFVESWKPRLDLIVPVPPSRPRTVQPVLSLAVPLSEALELSLSDDCVTKVADTPQLKNIYGYSERLKLLSDAFAIDADQTRNKAILLFDDLYRSGATMDAITSALYDQGEARDVYALTVTRTRSRR